MCGILTLLNGVVLSHHVVVESGLSADLNVQNEDIDRAALPDDFNESLMRRGPDSSSSIDVVF